MKLRKKLAALLLACVFGTALFLGGCAEKTVEDVQNNGPAESVMPLAEDGSVSIRAASYNVKNCGNGDSIEAVAKNIQAQNLDVACVQEVDNQTERTGGKNIVKLLSEACGLPYYHYYRVMDFQGGGYGIAILSKYALTACETIPLETDKKDEPRVLAKAEIKTEQGGVITVFNTHLSFESDQPRQKQIEFLNQQAKGKGAVLLMGDFNIKGFDEYSSLTELTPVNNESAPLASYRGDDESFRCLDNIFYSSDVRVNDVQMVDSNASDHNMLVLDARLAGE